MAGIAETVVAPDIKTSPVPPELVDACFLTTDLFDDYVKYVSSGGVEPDPRFAILDKAPDWSGGKDQFPLALCEFLAYKSVLAYEDDEAIRKHLAGKNCRGIREDSYKFFDSNPKGDTQGFGFVMGGTAFIVMRGSASLRDWRDDLTARMTDSSWISKRDKREIGDGPPRHLGFARAWANVLPEVEKWVGALPPDIKQFCFSGHSLGGALAIIGAHDFAAKGRDVVAVVTFAAPKVGAKEFADDYKNLGLEHRTLRLESDEDAVPWLTLSQRFIPVGIRWEIDRRPMIAGWEKFSAGLLGIAGWTRGTPTKGAKPTGDANAPAATKPTADSKPTTGDAPAPSKPGTTDQAAKPAEQIDAKKGVLVIVAVVAIVVVFLLTRKIIIRYRAHGVAKRYALYLTTLSYRRIRDVRIPDAQSASDELYKRASDDLDTHLSYIRARDGAIYKSVRNRPIRILTKQMAEKYAKQTGENGGYERYIW